VVATPDSPQSPEPFGGDRLLLSSIFGSVGSDLPRFCRFFGPSRSSTGYEERGARSTLWFLNSRNMNMQRHSRFSRILREMVFRTIIERHEAKLRAIPVGGTSLLRGRETIRVITAALPRPRRNGGGRFPSSTEARGLSEAGQSPRRRSSRVSPGFTILRKARWGIRGRARSRAFDSRCWLADFGEDEWGISRACSADAGIVGRKPLRFEATIANNAPAAVGWRAAGTEADRFEADRGCNSPRPDADPVTPRIFSTGGAPGRPGPESTASRKELKKAAASGVRADGRGPTRLQGARAVRPRETTTFAALHFSCMTAVRTVDEAGLLFGGTLGAIARFAYLGWVSMGLRCRGYVRAGRRDSKGKIK